MCVNHGGLQGGDLHGGLLRGEHRGALHDVQTDSDASLLEALLLLLVALVHQAAAQVRVALALHDTVQHYGTLTYLPGLCSRRVFRCCLALLDSRREKVFRGGPRGRGRVRVGLWASHPEEVPDGQGVQLALHVAGHESGLHGSVVLLSAVNQQHHLPLGQSLPTDVH